MTHPHVLRYFDDEGCVRCLVTGCGYEIKAGEILRGYNGLLDVFFALKPVKDYFDNLMLENTNLNNEVDRLYAELSATVQVLKSIAALQDEMLKIGASQAAEWDRFWAAMGVDSSEITVDEAIAQYKAVTGEIPLQDILALVSYFDATQQNADPEWLAVRDRVKTWANQREVAHE